MIQPYPRGITFKAVKSGLEFSKKRQKLVHAGQFVISRFRVRRGIWGLVPPDLDGGILSTHHLIFDLHPDLNPDYFAAYLAAPLFKRAAIAACSPHNRLLIPDFERISIPLPPAEMQAAIAEVWRSANAALVHTAEMFAAIAAIKAGVARDLLGKMNPSWSRSSWGRLRRSGAAVSGDHMLTFVSPDQIVLGVPPPRKIRSAFFRGSNSTAIICITCSKASSRPAERLLSAAPNFESALQSFPLALPTLYEQRKMAAVLQQHDETPAASRAERAALRRLDAGTMQLIFSGTLNLQEVAPHAASLS